MPDHISESARDLIQKILVIQPEKRFTVSTDSLLPLEALDLILVMFR